jgi:hypothetical protein
MWLSSFAIFLSFEKILRYAHRLLIAIVAHGRTGMSLSDFSLGNNPKSPQKCTEEKLHTNAESRRALHLRDKFRRTPKERKHCYEKMTCFRAN